MENRDRDKMSQRSEGTEAGDLNRETSEREGQERDSSVDFGQKIGQSEELNTPEKGSSGTGRPASTGMGKGQDRSGRSESDH